MHKKIPKNIKRIIQRIQENRDILVGHYQQCKEQKINGEQYMAYYEQFALPGGTALILEKLKNGDSGAIETAIAFLYADPFFFRSGYLKEEILRILKQISLSQDQIDLLHDILLNEITKKPARGYTDYCKLAQAIQDEPFREKIEGIANNSRDHQHREQAQIMLDTMDSHRKIDQ